MKQDHRSTRLSLIIGGAEGPISRLNLWERFRPAPRSLMALLLLSKMLLLGSMYLYFFR